MFGSKNKQKIIDEKSAKLNQALDSLVLSDSLEVNMDALKKLFEGNDTLITREIENVHNDSLKFCIAYCDGVVNSLIMNENIIKPLILSTAAIDGNNFMDFLVHQVLLINETKKTSRMKDIIESITYGDTILFAENSAEALILNTKGFQVRGISEPDGEKILSGPKEGFSESLLMNLSLIQRKLRTNELKMKFHSFGKRTSTNACICYIDSIVNKKILDEVFQRLDKIDIDAVLDSNYITELIRDARVSPFPTTGSTERPDIVVGKLLEGRIAIFVDGTPVVLTVPYLFIENFQSSEDYYLNFYYSSFQRMLRILGFFLTIITPGFYVAIVAFHHETLRTPLLVSISSARAGVPLPAFLEAFIMLIMFDILRETGVRMPSGVGQALSIVGALVIGQAAVEAKLVAAPMIIVVALTGITNLMVPKLSAPVIFIRLFLLAISSMLGLYGLTLGLSVILIHILNLHSFGVSQTFLGSFQFQNVKDISIRAPWWKMITRTRILAKDRIRMNSGDENGGN